jgi:tight adherence protein B
MGTLTGLIFGCGLTLVLYSLSPSVRTERKPLNVEKYWPQFCDDISTGVRAGLSVSESTWQASATLPFFLQDQFKRCKDEAERGIPFSLAIQNLSTQLKNSTFSRISFLITTAQSQDSRSLAGLLSEYAANLRADIELINEISGKQAVTKVSARVAAFAPLVVLALTSTRSSVRDSFLTSTGLMVVSASFFVTGISYLLMMKISKIKVLDV